MVELLDDDFWRLLVGSVGFACTTVTGPQGCRRRYARHLRRLILVYRETLAFSQRSALAMLIRDRVGEDGGIEATLWRTVAKHLEKEPRGQEEAVNRG